MRRHRFSINTFNVLLVLLSLISFATAVAQNAPPLPTGMPFPALPIATGSSVGALPGSWQVSPAGQFTYSIPLDVPAGRVQPNLALDYSSGRGSGPLGEGWALSGLSSITRCAKTLASDGRVDGIHYENTDKFCLDGNKLVAISGVYGGDETEYRTEHDTFVRIVSRTKDPTLGPDEFVVTTRAGTVSTYTPISSTVYGVTNRAGIISSTVYERWVLASVVDRSGNRIDYSYTIVDSATNGLWFGPKRIDYNRRTTNDVSYRYVEFEFEPRPDTEFAWQAGVKTSLMRRLKSITMYAPNPSNTMAVWKYFLSYKNSSFSNRSLLTAVKKCGMKGPVVGACTWEKQFDWYEEPAAPAFSIARFDKVSNVLAFDPANQTFSPIWHALGPGSVWPALHVADVDGDGSDDVLFQPGALPGNAVPHTLYVSRNQPPFGPSKTLGFQYPFAVEAPLTPQAPPPPGNYVQAVLSGGRTDLSRYYPLDLDGDGKSELFGSFDQNSTTCADEIVRWNGLDFEQVIAFPSYSCAEKKKTSHLFVDFDGDRRLDHMQVQRDGPQVTDNNGFSYGLWQIAMNVGGSFGPFTDTRLLAYPDATTPVDRNGDGRASVAGIWVPESETWFDIDAAYLDNWPHVYYGRSSASTWVKSQNDDFNALNQGVFNAFSQGVVGDFNGDGLMDFLYIEKISNYQDVLNPLSNYRAVLYFNTGHGFVLGSQPDLSPVLINYVIPIWGQESRQVRLIAADINHDGRDDIIALQHIEGPDCNSTQAKVDTWHQCGLVADNIVILLSKGDGTFSPVVINSTAGLFLGSNFPAQGFTTTKVGDFNGDGNLDIVRIDMKGPDGPYLQVLLNNHTWSDRVVAIRDQPTLWPALSISYSQKWTDKPDPDLPVSYPKHHIRRGLVVVRQVDLRDHIVDPSSTNPPPRSLYYSYEGPLSDLRGRGFLGFKKIRIWDPTAPTEKIFGFANDVQWSEWPSPAYPYALRPVWIRTVTPLDPPKIKSGVEQLRARVTQFNYESQVKSLNGGKSYADLPSTWTSLEWEQPVSINWGALDPSPGTNTDHIFGVDSRPSILRRRWGSDKFDEYGNLTDHTEQTQDGASLHVTWAYDNTGPKIVASYPHSKKGPEPLVSNWLSLLRQETVTAQEPGQPAVTRTTNYDYDSLDRLSAVHREQDNSDPSVRQTTTLTRDDYGLVTDIVTTAGDSSAPPPRHVHIEYEPWWPGQPDERIFPSQFWADFTPLAYRPTYWVVFHPAYGVPMSSLDANAVSTVTSYDDLGRPLNIYPTGATSIALSYDGRPDKAGGINGVVITATQMISTSTPKKPPASQWRSTRDALGREIVASVTGFDGTLFNTETKYDSLGRVVSRSRPYTAAPPNMFTTYTYDPLNRLILKQAPDGSKVNYAHTFLNATRWDEELNESSIYSDLNGRIVKTVSLWRDARIPTSVTTSLAYEPFGLLHSSTDPKGHQTIYKYDVIGRTVLVTDPDAGSVQLVYNGFDSVISKVHLGSGDTTTFTFDSLGRLKSSSGPEGTASFFWDTQPNGLGKIASSTSADAVQATFNYDFAGRSLGYTEQVSGTNFTVGLAYDTQGRLQKMQYPSVDGTSTPGLTLDYTYNDANFVSQINYSAPDVPSKVLWKATARNLDGSLLHAQLGPTLSLTHTYDPKLPRLVKTEYEKSFEAVSGLVGNTRFGSQTVFDIDYTYYLNGFIKTRKDNVANRGEAFTYDTLGRLLRWDVTHNGITRKSQYDYDADGNLLATDLDGVPVENNGYGQSGGLTPHAITSQVGNGGTATIGYDSHGRQTTVGDIRSITQYSDANLPKSIITAGQKYSFLYDAFGARAKQSSPTGSWTYIGETYERRTNNGVTTHLFHVVGPDGAIVDLSRDDSKGTLTATYLLSDALGSVDALADQTGYVEAGRYYEPFGRPINDDSSLFNGSIGVINEGFTGQEHDEKIGLINMRGRMYDPSLKHMLTPDPVIAAPLYSQSWNRYSYVWNNPVNFTDPTGYQEGDPPPPEPDPGPDNHTVGPGMTDPNISSSSNSSSSSSSASVCSRCSSYTPWQGPDPMANGSFLSQVPQSSQTTYSEPADVCYPGPSNFAIETNAQTAASAMQQRPTLKDVARAWSWSSWSPVGARTLSVAGRIATGKIIGTRFFFPGENPELKFQGYNGWQAVSGIGSVLSGVNGMIPSSSRGPALDPSLAVLSVAQTTGGLIRLAGAVFDYDNLRLASQSDVVALLPIDPEIITLTKLGGTIATFAGGFGTILTSGYSLATNTGDAPRAVGDALSLTYGALQVVGVVGKGLAVGSFAAEVAPFVGLFSVGWKLDELIVKEYGSVPSVRSAIHR